MNAKISPGGHGRIQYLLRCAFKAAEEGDRHEAYHYYELAVSEGYLDSPRTRANLEFHLNKSSLDPSDEVIVEIPPDAIQEEWKPSLVEGLGRRLAEHRMWRMGQDKPKS
jgi:hypothetical protein